jgi:hypothetical protein
MQVRRNADVSLTTFGRCALKLATSTSTLYQWPNSRLNDDQDSIVTNNSSDLEVLRNRTFDEIAVGNDASVEPRFGGNAEPITPSQP